MLAIVQSDKNGEFSIIETGHCDQVILLNRTAGTVAAILTVATENEPAAGRKNNLFTKWN